MNKNNLNLNALRMLGVQAVNKANSGHPGIILGAAPMVYELFTNIMNVNPENDQWMNRDRFVLSAGHGSGLLYSMLHLAGYGLKIEDLKEFRQLNSLTPGHPEYGHTKGVDATTGPLGQGLTMAVGMALAESHLASKFNKPNFDIMNHFTYVLCGDGDLQEGVAQEAISFAGRYKLNKLILLHDSNDIQLDAPVNIAQSEDMQAKFKAANWNTILVKNGEDLKEINSAILLAQKSDKPTYIEVKTIIGLGASKQGTPSVHGAPLGADIQTVKNYFNWTSNDFEIPNEVYEFYKENVLNRGKKANEIWNVMFEKYKIDFPQLAQEFLDNVEKKWNIDEQKVLAKNQNLEQATRISSQQVFNELSAQIPAIFGGSADLSESTKIKGLDGNYDFNNPTGRNVMYGVREFAMASINNGIALHKGLLPVASGFFVFADYLKPALRLSAIMNLQSLYVFTHDSIAVGEDGPTHQPIEQLAMIRSIPNISVYRPCDYAETAASYMLALADKTTPSVLILTRQNLVELEHKNVVEDVSKGAYIIKENPKATISLIATGSEVKLALDIAQILLKDSIQAKVISMPNQNLFEKQSQNYKDQIIDKNTQRFSLELSTTYGWYKYLGDSGKAYGIDTFGYSAPFGDVLKHIKFTAQDIASDIKKQIK